MMNLTLPYFFLSESCTLSNQCRELTSHDAISANEEGTTLQTEIGAGTGCDLTNYTTPLGALLYILSSFADDTDSEPITCWHSVYSLTHDRINIHIHYVR